MAKTRPEPEAQAKDESDDRPVDWGRLELQYAAEDILRMIKRKDPLPSDVEKALRKFVLATRKRIDKEIHIVNFVERAHAKGHPITNETKAREGTAFQEAGKRLGISAPTVRAAYYANRTDPPKKSKGSKKRD